MSVMLRKGESNNSEREKESLKLWRANLSSLNRVSPIETMSLRYFSPSHEFTFLTHTRGNFDSSKCGSLEGIYLCIVPIFSWKQQGYFQAPEIRLSLMVAVLATTTAKRQNFSNAILALLVHYACDLRT